MHAQAKQEADTVAGVTADANVMPNGDTPAAVTAPDKSGQADVAAGCAVAAPQEAAAKASAAPVKVTDLMPDFAWISFSSDAIFLHSSSSLPEMAGPVLVSW